VTDVIHYELKVQVLRQLQKGRCAITGRQLSACGKVDLHHAGVPDRKWARARWPLLVDGLLNLVLVSSLEHEGHGHERDFGIGRKLRAMRMTDEGADRIESALRADPYAADVMNCRGDCYAVETIRRVRDRVIAQARVSCPS
jgi:hypothetical protein